MGKMNTEHQYTSSPRQEQPSVEKRVNEAKRTLDKDKKIIDAIPDAAKKAKELEDLGKGLKKQITQITDKLEQELRSNAKIESYQQEAVDQANIATRAILHAVQNELIQPPKNSKAILQRLANMTIADTTAAYLAPFIKKYIEEDITFSKEGEAKTEFEKYFAELQESAPEVAGVLTICIESNASQFGLTKETIQKKLQTKNIERNAKREFKQNWEQYELGTPFDTDEDKETVRALYSLDHFKDLLVEIKFYIEKDPKNSGLSKEKIDQLISVETTNRIVLLFSKLFKELDKAKSREAFETIARQGGMWTSIEVVYKRLTSVLGRLASQASGEKIPDGFAFYQKFSAEEYGVAEREITSIDETGKKILDSTGKEIKIKKKIPQYRVCPVPASEQMYSFSEFLHTIKTQVDQLYITREYLHNVRYLVLQQPGDKGFWAQMAGYAEKMRGTDIDTIMLLPGSDIFMAAFRLYIKQLEESFAKLDWRHAPNMFSDDLNSVRNKIEKNVDKTLRAMFPDLSGKHGWRIDAALSIASGLAKGVFLTEIEIAAWADPHLDRKKENEAAPTFVSFFYNDHTALNAFNLIHTILRFQSQNLTIGPLLYMTLTGKKSDLFKSWNHKVLWEQMEKFKKSFDRGESVLLPEEGKFLFNMLVNWGRVGGMQTRSGWDTAYPYEGWLQYKSTEDGTGRSFDLDYLNSWKAIENIGFEAILQFSSTVLVADCLSELDTKSKNYREKNELFAYLFEKYIQKDPSHRLEAEKDTIRLIVAKEIDAQIQKDLISKPKNNEERNKLIEKALYKRLLYKVLTKVICQRMPTKFVRIERDRSSTYGTRSWQEISDKVASITADWDENDMDEAIKNITIVETMARKETTDKMKEHTNNQEKKSLFNCAVDTYKIDEDKIKAILNKVYRDDPNKAKKIHNACTVWKQINLMQLSNDSFLNKFAYKLENNKKENYFPFALGMEELEMSFLALRNAGERPLPRRVGDVAKIEQGLSGPLLKYLGTLRQVAASGKHDPSELIKGLYEMYQTVDGIHGDYAYEIVYYAARTTINYFKKDTYSKYFLTKIFSIGKPHSLATRIGGANRNIWEWGVRDIDHFITELERLALLKKDPFDARKKPEKGQKPDFVFCGKLLRQESGATKANIALELGLNYGPLVVLALFLEWLKDAWKEITGGKQQQYA